jgi:two-component system sensor histidine kinase QseC
MKTYSLRKATLASLFIPLVAAILVTAVSAVWVTDRAIGLLRDDQMQQEAAFLLLLARHEAREGESLGLIHTLESTELREVLGARSSFRIWSGDTVVTRSSSEAILPPLPQRPGFSDQKSNGKMWRTYVMREPGTDIVIEVCEPKVMRTTMTMQVVSSLALPLLFLLSAVSAIAYAQINIAMRPMRRISHDLDSRQPDDFRPLGGYRIPEEIAPLFAAFNRLMTRLGAAIAREREFTDNAAHELRTPLTVLKTRAQIVARDLEGDPARHDHAAQLVEATNRAAAVIDQLLLLNRVGAKQGEPDRVDYSALVEAVCRDTGSAAIAKGQQFEVDIVPGLIVSGQSDMLAMMVANLVENAIRHTPADSQIHVNLTQAPAGTARLRICDTGGGIAPAHHQAAFDRFQRLGSERPGSGLGLAIVRRIVEQHDGSISLATNTPQGLCVEVDLSIRSS